MVNKLLRVGIIGIGAYAAMAHVSNFRKTGKAEVVAICRRDPKRLAMAQTAFGIAEAYTDWREMLERAPLDAIVVSTPHDAHTEPTLAALACGLHVLVEKPMALTSQDAWAMVAAAEQAERILMVGYSGRLVGKWQTAKQCLDRGELGQIRQINQMVSTYRRWFWQTDTMPDDVRELIKTLAQATNLPEAFFANWGHTWHCDPAKMGGGAFTDIGTHTLDRLLWLAGAPPVEVMAFTESAGMPVECFINVQARLESIRKFGRETMTM